MTKEEALERLRSRCSRAEYCSGQISEAIRRWITCDKKHLPATDGSEGKLPPLSESDIPDIISQLKAERFLDDRRFAEAFVRDKLKFNGWGRNKIAYKLKSLGLEKEVIEESLSANYYGMNEEGLSGYSVLEKLVEKKYASLKSEDSLPVKRMKVIRFAMGRGFEYGAIIEAVEKIIK